MNLTIYVPGHGKSGPADQAVTPFLTCLQRFRDGVTKGYHAEKEGHEIKKDILVVCLILYAGFNLFAFFIFCSPDLIRGAGLLAKGG